MDAAGLLSLTGTDLQKNGSLHGAGIYLSTSPQVAMSFGKPGDTLAPLPDNLVHAALTALRSATEHSAQDRGPALPVEVQATSGIPQQTRSHTTDFPRHNLGGLSRNSSGAANQEASPGAPGVSPVQWCEDVLAQHSVLGAQPVFLLACQVFVGPGVRRGPEAEEQAPACVVCGKRLRVQPRCTGKKHHTACEGSLGSAASHGESALRDGQGADRSAPEQEKGGLGTYVVVESPNMVTVRYVMAYHCSPTTLRTMAAGVAAMGSLGTTQAALNGVQGQGQGEGRAGRLPMVDPRVPQGTPVTVAWPVRRGSDTCSMLLWAYAVLLIAVGLAQSPWVSTWKDWLIGFWYPKDVDLDLF